MKTGKLIVFEGADEVGKTTLAKMLGAQLRSHNVACEVIGFPGNNVGTLGRHIYELHHNPKRFRVRQINPVSLQLLHVAAHIDEIERRIIPALEANKTIILDRFWWSSRIYGTANGGNENSLKRAIQAEIVHWQSIRPSCVFVVTCPLPFEKQTNMQKWKRIKHLYKKFASREARKYPVFIIDNNTTPEAAFEEVQKVVRQFFR